MKKILLLIGILVSITAAQVVFGQTTEGVILYEVKVNMHKTLPPDRHEMKNMIPEFRASKEQLAFNATESLYKRAEEDVEEEDINNGEGAQIRLRVPQNEFYVNQATSRKSTLQEFMGKKYLIEDLFHLRAWKFENETKDIKGYVCKKATFYNEERKQTIVAWYTDKLRPFLGPENLNTLPGTVLQVDINDGERIVTALNIEARPLKKNELKISSGGIKTTEPELRKLRDEQMERMRANGGNIIIRN